MINHKTLF